jgi:hypothetical protein
MASLESLQTRALAAQTVSGITVDDKSIALAIVHTSSDAITSVTNIAATSLEMIDAVETVTCTYATDSDTLGKLVDRINASANWKARIIDGLRSTTTAGSRLIPDSAITAVTVNGESVYRVFIDQSVEDSVFYRVSADRGVLNTDFGQLKDQVAKGGHRVKIAGITYRTNISGATANGVRIYEFDAVTLAETQVWGATSVDDTKTTHDFSLNPIAAREGNDLIVRITDSAVSDAITNFLQVDYIRE